MILKDNEVITTIKDIIESKLKDGIQGFKIADGESIKQEKGVSVIVSKDNINYNVSIDFEGGSVNKITLKVNSFEIQSQLLIKTKSFLKKLFEKDFDELFKQVDE